MKKILDIQYIIGGTEEERLDLYLPDGKPRAVFVYLHGGGIENGGKNWDEATSIAKHLTSHGIAVVTPNYRLYPRAHYPEFIEDAAESVAWTKRKMQEYGEDIKLFVGGSSAGGYLSMMLCYDPKYLGACGISPDEVYGFVHDAGQPTTHFNVCRERGLDTRRCIIDEAAPLFHVGLAKEYPRQLFIGSDNDIEARFEQTALMLRTLRHFGYDESRYSMRLMRGYTHCGYMTDFDENGVSVLARIICEYIESLA